MDGIPDYEGEAERLRMWKRIRDLEAELAKERARADDAEHDLKNVESQLDGSVEMTKHQMQVAEGWRVQTSVAREDAARLAAALRFHHGKQDAMHGVCPGCKALAAHEALKEKFR